MMGHALSAVAGDILQCTLSIAALGEAIELSNFGRSRGGGSCGQRREALSVWEPRTGEGAGGGGEEGQRREGGRSDAADGERSSEQLA
jgi:hypothetical protein